MEQAGLIIGILGGILGAVGVVCSIIFGSIAWKRTRQQDVTAEVATDTGMKFDIEYIKRGVDSIQVVQQRMQDDIGRVSERVTRVEEVAKSAHRRLDEYINMHPPDTNRA